MAAVTDDDEIEITDMMHVALCEALYVYRTPFVWIYFTPHGIVAGRLSRHSNE